MTDETLADVDHTHPHTDETFGGVYRRGPAVADGAGPGVGVEVDAESLREVDHGSAAETTPDIWTRGPRDDGADEPGPAGRGPDGATEDDR